MIESQFRCNTEAYKYLLLIEVGLREFLISAIIDMGIDEWYNQFLGDNQKDAIANVIQRISKCKKDETESDIKDIYLYKLNRTKVEMSKLPEITILDHPFYYLDWTDLEKLISMKVNTNLFESKIGKANRLAISSILSSLNGIRNSIAHSRIIENKELKIIKGAYEQIEGIIFDFHNFHTVRSREKSLIYLIPNTLDIVKEIQISKTLKKERISEMEKIFIECNNSFWLRTFYNESFVLLQSLKNSFEKYKEYRNKPGGLIEIHNWHQENKYLMNEIVNSFG